MKKMILSSLSILGGAAAAAVAVRQVMKKEVEAQWRISEKHLALYRMMDQWVAIKQQGKNLADYFEKMQYKVIAVYGMSYAGLRLAEELENSNIEIKYGIDKNAEAICSDIDVVTMQGQLTEVDAVVVTPIVFFNEIEKELSEKLDCPIISLEDILYEI